LDFLVGLEHHPAALADPMDRDGMLVGCRDDGLEGPGTLARRDLDAVLPAVAETLAGSGQVVRIADRKVECLQDFGSCAHPR
jgi:hypothetical protein